VKIVEIDSSSKISAGYVLEDPNRIFREKDPNNFLILSFKLYLKRKDAAAYMKAVIENGIAIATPQ
jgi:hypothetical protein